MHNKSLSQDLAHWLFSLRLTMQCAGPIPLTVRKPSAILLDISRTVTLGDFSSLILNPFTKNNMAAYLERNWLEISLLDQIDQMREDAALDGGPKIGPNVVHWLTVVESTIDYVSWCIREGKQQPPLKSFL